MRKKQYRELTEHVEKVELLCHQINGRLDALNKRLEELSADLRPVSGDEWITNGLNSIMSFQAGKKKGAEE